MRANLLLVLAAAFLALGALQAKPMPDKNDEPTTSKAPAFKPIEIKSEVVQDDPKDEKLNNPSKKYTVKLHKDKTYVIDLQSKDFDIFLRLLNKKGKRLAEDDDDSGGDRNAQIVYAATETGDHHIVATSSDGTLGKFTLNVREVKLNGEAKPRKVGKDGLEVNDEIAQKDETSLGKLTRILSVQLKAGQAYRFDIDSQDFDCHLFVFDGKSKLLGQDLAKVTLAPTTDGVHHLVVKSFDGKLGKFDLKIREFILKGEAEPRELGKNGLAITDKIGNNDESPVGKLGKVFSVQLKGGQTYVFRLDSNDLDAYLYLFDSSSALLAQDDDSGGGTSSRIVFRPERDGVYHLLASSLVGDETGEFTLNVRKKE